MTILYNPNQFPLIPESELRKAVDELNMLYRTIEELVFVLHAQARKFFGNEDLTGSDSLAFRNILEFVRNYAQLTMSDAVRLPLEQYANIDLLIDHIGSVYRRNLQRYLELLNGLPYKPIQFANETLSNLGLQGKDIASIVYEFQFLMSTVQQAFVEFVDQLTQTGHPAFTYLRNTYTVYIGALSYLLPFVYQIKSALRNNIKDIGSREVFNELLARIYGLHIKLLRGWLVKDFKSTNLFFVDFDVTDITQIKRLYEQVIQGKLVASETMLMSESETKSIINNDELYRHIATKTGIYRTPYVVAHFVSKHNLGQAVFLLLKTFVSLYLLYKQNKEKQADLDAVTIERFVKLQLGDEYLDYAKQLLLTKPDLLLDVAESRVVVELFGEVYEASVIELLLLFLVGVGYLMQNTFGLDDTSILDISTVNTNEDALLVALIEAEFLRTSYNHYKERRNRETLNRLLNAIKSTREVVALYESLLNTVLGDNYKSKYGEFIKTFLASDITMRVNVLIKLGSIVLLLLMPALDANLLLLPIIESLYVYASINTVLASIIVADVILRLFELPYRVVKTNTPELGYTINDVANYLAFDDIIKVILGTSLIGQDCSFYQRELVLATNDNCAIVDKLKSIIVSRISGSVIYSKNERLLRDIQNMQKFMLLVCTPYIDEERCLLLETKNDEQQYTFQLPKNIDDFTEWSEKTLWKYVWQ